MGELENLLNQAAQEMHSAQAREESRGAHAHENFPERDDEKWMKHTLSFLDKTYVEDAKVILKSRGVIDQPLDSEMHHVPPAKRCVEMRCGLPLTGWTHIFLLQSGSPQLIAYRSRFNFLILQA